MTSIVLIMILVEEVMESGMRITPENGNNFKP